MTKKKKIRDMNLREIGQTPLVSDIRKQMLYALIGIVGFIIFIVILAYFLAQS